MPPADSPSWLERLVLLVERTWLFHLMNLLVAGIWVHDGIVAGARFLETRQPASLLLCGLNLLLVLFYLGRRRASKVGASAKAIVAANVGTFSNFLYQPGDPLRPWLETPCTVMMVAWLLLSVAAFLSLGRSWGIIPANRGVKTGGLYRIVRHPIYASYILFDWTYVIAAFTWRNLALALTVTLVLYARARYEEEVLLADPEYAAYARRTRFMLLPGLL